MSGVSPNSTETPTTPATQTAAQSAPPPGGKIAVGCEPLQPATWGWLLALTACTIIVSFYDLAGGSKLEPVEAWVAQPARETYEKIQHMLANVEEQGWSWRPFVIPEFSSETRMQKSPGAVWTVILVAWLRGTPVDEVAIRIPNAISAVLMVLTIFWLTRRIAGDRAAIFAGFATAGSGMLLHWSHNGASDMGVATLITMSLACLWVASEDEPPGAQRVLLWLAGYLFAGLAMLYKMPLPIACVGLPAIVYVLIRRRWSIFASWWHLLGLLLFLLPWLPWALAAMHFEEMAAYKWRVEYIDRLTGDLPNVDEQKKWYWAFYYVGVVFLLAVPFCLSTPLALVRAFRRDFTVRRDGVLFLVVWLLSLLAFFSIAVGKETRYILPVMPPMFALLGRELSYFFSREHQPGIGARRAGFVAVLLLIPAGAVALGYGLRLYWEAHAVGTVAWDALLTPFIVAASIFTLGAILSAWLYLKRKPEPAFAALVGAVWLMWLWAWPMLMPGLVSQAAFTDIAQQMHKLSPDQQTALRQVAHQDPRIIWYSDVRFPRVIDQLEMLEMQGGVRNLERERRLVGERMIDLLEAPELALFVTAPFDYLAFQTEGEVELEKAGREMPENHVWLQATVGGIKDRFIVFGNHAPPWPEPKVNPPLQDFINRRLKKLRAEAELPASRTQPTTERVGTQTAPEAELHPAPQPSAPPETTVPQ